MDKRGAEVLVKPVISEKIAQTPESGVKNRVTVCEDNRPVGKG